MLAAKTSEGVKLWSLPEMELIWQAEEIKTKVGVEDGMAFSWDKRTYVHSSRKGGGGNQGSEEEVLVVWREEV